MDRSRLATSSQSYFKTPIFLGERETCSGLRVLLLLGGLCDGSRLVLLLGYGLGLGLGLGGLGLGWLLLQRDRLRKMLLLLLLDIHLLTTILLGWL